MQGMERRISVRAIVWHDGKLLCARLKSYPGALSVSKDEWWCTPGGGLESGEALLEGIHREMLEETGITPVIGNLLYVQQFPHGNKEYLEFFFHITNATDYLDIDLTKTTHGAAEIEEIGFVDPKAVTLLPTFLTTEDLESHIPNGNPTQFFTYYPAIRAAGG
jgi:ADP-ribose pyrophosphatase YjhB (NUDIX family)